MKCYFDRNRLWLTFALGGLMMVTLSILLPLITGLGTNYVTTWLRLGGTTVATFGAGIGAMFIDTTSARLVRFLGLATGFADVFYLIFK